MWKRLRNLIIVEFSLSVIPSIKRVCCQTCRSRMTFRRRFAREMLWCWRQAREVIRTELLLWSSWLARRRCKAFTWRWDLRWRRSSAIIRLTKVWRELCKGQLNHRFTQRHASSLIENDAESYGGFPFEFEKIFKIAIGFDAAGVRVSVNGKFFCEYPYKARLALFSGLKIREKNDLYLHILELHHHKVDKRLSQLDTLSCL